jgi:bla regulator protein BlaR1
MRTESKEMLAVGIFGNKSRLGDRVEMLLRRGRTFSPRTSVGGVMASVAVLGAMMLAGSLAPRWIAFAQQQARPSFEVASVKPGNPNNPQVCVCVEPPGRFFSINATLKMLIVDAYNVRNHQISGGPNWLDSAKFDIEARMPRATPMPAGSDGPPQILRLMEQSLLAERFKLAVHRETREEQLYELVVDKGGPKLKESTDTLRSGVPQGIGFNGRGHVTGTAANMLLFVSQLSQMLGRTVIDKTGLTGRYDFTLKWAPDPGVPGARPDGPDAPPPPDPDGPSIFTAIREDLGLKLQSAKGPVEILVIDHAEKPDAN